MRFNKLDFRQYFVLVPYESTCKVQYKFYLYLDWNVVLSFMSGITPYISIIKTMIDEQIYNKSKLKRAEICF